MRNVSTLSLCGDADQLGPGIAPFHAFKSDIDSRLTFEICHQLHYGLIVCFCVGNEREFKSCHACLTVILLIDRTVFAIIVRTEGVAFTPQASMPRMAAPITGGTRSRTRRALGANLWMVSRMGSISIGPPSNILPVMTTSKARFSNSNCRITAFAISPNS